LKQKSDLAKSVYNQFQGKRFAYSPRQHQVFAKEVVKKLPRPLGTLIVNCCSIEKSDKYRVW